MPRIATLPLADLLLEVLASMKRPQANTAPLAAHKHEATGSHVPHQRPDQARATFMPDIAWPINRHPPDSSRSCIATPVLMSPINFRHVIDGSLSLAFLIHT